MNSPPANDRVLHAAGSLESTERPILSDGDAGAPAFGSDVIADAIRALDIPYVTINPGASMRGLQDSLVNYLGNEAPKLLLCLHEESAVAIAHGYAKVTGRAMAAMVHSNVGLLHAGMAIFNAWCDRAPMLVIGATGPVDAVKRRPWIDWIHTTGDQAALVRPYLKFDDQPASAEAAQESLLRAAWLANSAPTAPVYVNLDAGMQEARLEAPVPPLDIRGYGMPAVSGVQPEIARQASAALSAAKRPLILIGRVSRSLDAWNARVLLAEALGARVITDIKTGCSFPGDHPLCVGGPVGLIPHDEAIAALRQADLILSLDWVDLAGIMQAAGIRNDSGRTTIRASLDYQLHKAGSMDYQALPPVDIMIAAQPDAAVPALLAAVDAKPKTGWHVDAPVAVSRPAPSGSGLTLEDLARNLRAAVGERPVTLAHLPLPWQGDWWPFRHPLDFVGADGGAGIGGGPGISVGVALALRGSGRMCVSVCGDGDYLMGVTALWTAVHYKLPLLLVVQNNRSFFNDEVHQERVARVRGRPLENRWIGQRIADPVIDLAKLARAQGAIGIGPVGNEADLLPALREAVAAVEKGAVVVVDVLADVSSDSP